jgi:hypothetical protein
MGNANLFHESSRVVRATTAKTARVFVVNFIVDVYYFKNVFIQFGN